MPMIFYHSLIHSQSMQDEVIYINAPWGKKQTPRHVCELQIYRERVSHGSQDGTVALLDATGQVKMKVFPTFVLFLPSASVPSAAAPWGQPPSLEECSGAIFRCPVTRECISDSWPCDGVRHSADEATEATETTFPSVGFFANVVGTGVGVVLLVLYIGFKCWLCSRFFASPADIANDDEDATSLVGGPMADDNETD